MELILVVVISAGMAGNSQNGVSRSNSLQCYIVACLDLDQASTRDRNRSRVFKNDKYRGVVE